MEDIDLDDLELKCKTHPKYKGIRRPKKTANFPNGCPKCLEIFQEAEMGRDFENDLEIKAEIARLVEKDD